MAGRGGPVGLHLFAATEGTHNRGVIGSILTKNGVAIRPAGLEAPRKIGRVHRRGAMLKRMMPNFIKDTHVQAENRWI